MTEKQTHLKPIIADAASDATAVDVRRAEAEARSETTPPESEPEFSPGKFCRIEIPLDMRKQMLETKLPRLAPEFFQDTLPPNQALDASSFAEDEEQPVPRAPQRRPPVALVVACLLGAALLLALALVRSTRNVAEPKPPPQTPQTPQGIEAPIAPTLPVVSAVPPVAAPIISAAPVSPPAAATRPKRDVEQPHAVTAPRSKEPAASTRSEPVPVSPVAPLPAPSVSATAPAPTQTSWVNPR